MKYMRNDHRRRHRLRYTSPAEVKFIRLFGGKVVTINFMKSRKNKFPRTIVLTMGRTLKREFVQRELRVGGVYVDFAFVNRYTKKAIEIDGAEFHRDVVREQQRDDYLHGYGYSILHIPAVDLYRKPDAVKKRVITFLAK